MKKEEKTREKTMAMGQAGETSQIGRDGKKNNPLPERYMPKAKGEKPKGDDAGW